MGGGPTARGARPRTFSVSSRVPEPNPNAGAETFVDRACGPKKETRRFSRTA
jgi:hypothetical protein